MITLKSVKIYERLSEETTAFSATVYYAGRKAGEASNDGHGGSTMIRLDPATRATVEAWAQANVPPGEDPCDGAVEYHVDNLVEAHAQAAHEAREAKRVARIDAQETAKLRARGLAVVVRLHYMTPRGETMLWAGAQDAASLPATMEALAKRRGTPVRVVPL